MNFKEYKILHSETIMYYQLIEDDIKWIFSYMKNGEPTITRNKITNLTLGKIVDDLKKLDCSDNDPIISKDDYNFLKQITKNRNFWAHENFLWFIECDSNTNNDSFVKNYKKLLKDHNQAKAVSLNIKEIRKNTTL